MRDIKRHYIIYQDTTLKVDQVITNDLEELGLFAGIAVAVAIETGMSKHHFLQAVGMIWEGSSNSQTN